MLQDEIIRIVPKPRPTARDIAALRSVCGLSIAEIRNAAESQESIRDIVVFSNTWQEERLLLRDICHSYLQGDAPFNVFEDTLGHVEQLSPTELMVRLTCYRGIELEQQRLSDLENGHIATSSEFRPHDESWI